MEGCTDADTLCPVTRPLFTLQELYEWTSDGVDQCRSRIPYVGKNEGQCRPKVLVCHDMKGGYLEDRFVQGVSAVDCFRFHNWWKTDTFIYFSHHLVTLPPICWIDAGHQHGVKVLGTLITEWDVGKKVCEEFLKDETTFKRTADKLVLLAQYYHFDGWLINIENELQADQVSVLQEFLRYLTKEMHQHIEHSEIIWYDSVTKEGILCWQNELNQENYCFFEACDGIFLNYTWKDGNLQASADIARNLGRLHDVFVGIDVYGRGCFGDGGYNTNMAMQVAKTRDLSVAIFGIGWTLEKCQAGENFLDRDERYWKLLKDFCPERKVSHLPFVTSFCQGWGHRYYCCGQVLSDTAWTSLSLQQVQPTEDSRTEMKYITTDGYLGGGCLEFTKTKDTSQIRIFSMDTVIEDELHVSYTYKAITQGQFDLQLTVVSSDDIKTIRFHLANNDSLPDDKNLTETTKTTDVSIHSVEDVHLKASGADNSSCEWVTRKFQIPDCKAMRLTDISIVFPCNNKTCVFQLGQLKVVPEQIVASTKTVAGRLTASDGSRTVLAHLDVKETFTKKQITDDGKPKSDEQLLPQRHLLTETNKLNTNTDKGSFSSVEQEVNPPQHIQSENNPLDTSDTKKHITDDGKPKSDEQLLPQRHLLTETNKLNTNTDKGSFSSVEQEVNPPQHIQSENNPLDTSLENAVAIRTSASPMLNMKLTWDLPSDILAHVNCFHVYMWSETKQAWHFLGHTPVGSYAFSLGAHACHLELAKFKLEAVLVTGDLISGMNMNVKNN